MNQSAVFPIRFRQIGCDSSSWKLLLPGSAMPFAWEDLQKEHKLEVMVDGAEPSRSRIVAIDECADYEPLESGSTPVAAFHIRIFREGSVQVVKVSDWTPSNQSLSLLPFNSSNMEQSQLAYKTKSANQHQMEHQIQISFNLFELGISLVDHTPEELLYVSVQDFSLLYATGLGSGISR
jgi:vacuolar protein sorting-associated protein 13A/C